MHLVDVEQGIWVRVVGFDGGVRLKRRLIQHSLYPGDQARVLRAAPLNGPLLVEVSGREIAIGRVVVEKILVEPA